MQETKRILQERIIEIDEYYSYISSINENQIDPTVFKILKANILLMLYNFVEAVVSNSVDAIRSGIHNDNDANFDCLKNEIKSQIIRDLKQNISPDNFVHLCSVISKDIIKMSFKKENISKGNIDRDVINSISLTYGFNVKNSNYVETGHGETLTVIKDKRNDLAHGTFSFAEIGKEYSIPDLEKLKNKTVKYLTFVVNEIEVYLTSKLYLN